MAILGIVGAGGCAREIMPLVRNMQFDEPVEAAFFIVPKATQERINGVRQISEADFLRSKEPRLFNVGIADSRKRQRLADIFEGAGCRPVSIFARDFVRYENVAIAAGAVFCPFTMATINVRIGRYFHANMYANVAHDCVIGDFVTFAPGARCNGNVHIGDHAYIGSGAVLRDGREGMPLRIGAGAVVGMGAVVTRAVEPGMVVVGNPARPLAR
jgi:sugar O-acyltransferase (sialic acid O-acetyltransferase NeuD family)